MTKRKNPDTESYAIGLKQEHAAWHDVMTELRRLGVEPNHATSDCLIKAIASWGALLALWRVSQQSDKQAAQAFNDAITSYVRAKMRRAEAQVNEL